MANRSNIRYLLARDDETLRELYRHDDSVHKYFEGVISALFFVILVAVFAAVVVLGLRALDRNDYPAPEQIGLVYGQGPYIHFSNGDEISLDTVRMER